MKQAWLITVTLLAVPLMAQEQVPEASVDGALDPEAHIDALRDTAPRELSVLAPTLPPEAIDRAVLNRLMQEIAQDPESIRARLGASDSELEDSFVLISNARSFINTNDMANIRAMCRAWDNSSLQGDARIEEALEAYKRRAQFTSNFIARYYRLVLHDIQSSLSPLTLSRFNAYMEDRRRRMANAGNLTFGTVVENVSSGAEAVRFHCRA